MMLFFKGYWSKDDEYDDIPIPDSWDDALTF